MEKYQSTIQAIQFELCIVAPVDPRVVSGIGAISSKLLGISRNRKLPTSNLVGFRVSLPGFDHVGLVAWEGPTRRVRDSGPADGGPSDRSILAQPDYPCCARFSIKNRAGVDASLPPVNRWVSSLCQYEFGPHRAPNHDRENVHSIRDVL